MITEKDKKAIEKGKKLIKEQVEETEKLDLGLDADSSSEKHGLAKSEFDAFINPQEPPTLEDK